MSCVMKFVPVSASDCGCSTGCSSGICTHLQICGVSDLPLSGIPVYIHYSATGTPTLASPVVGSGLTNAAIAGQSDTCFNWNGSGNYLIHFPTIPSGEISVSSIATTQPIGGLPTRGYYIGTPSGVDASSVVRNVAQCNTSRTDTNNFYYLLRGSDNDLCMSPAAPCSNVIESYGTAKLFHQRTGESYTGTFNGSPTRCLSSGWYFHDIKSFGKLFLPGDAWSAIWTNNSDNCESAAASSGAVGQWCGSGKTFAGSTNPTWALGTFGQPLYSGCCCCCAFDKYPFQDEQLETTFTISDPDGGATLLSTNKNSLTTAGCVWTGSRTSSYFDEFCGCFTPSDGCPPEGFTASLDVVYTYTCRGNNHGLSIAVFYDKGTPNQQSYSITCGLVSCNPGVSIWQACYGQYNDGTNIFSFPSGTCNNTCRVGCAGGFSSTEDCFIRGAFPSVNADLCNAKSNNPGNASLRCNSFLLTISA